MHVPLSKLNAQLSPDKSRLRFNCPACPKIHYVIISFDKKDDPHWELTGNHILNLSVSPSIDGTHSGCRLHGWIKLGEVSW